MSPVLMVISRSLALTAVLLIAGCASDRQTFAESFFQLAQAELFGPGEQPAAPTPTRAQLDEIPYAMIALSRVNDPRRGFIVPVADTGGHLFYQDINRSGVVLRGGLITATHGFARNLSAVLHQDDDPVAVPTPVANWPVTVVRNYQLARMSTDDYEITVTCSSQPVARERIEIIERFYEVMRIQEICINPARSFTNTYWAEPETGFIWKSEQWIGPQRAPLIIEVIRPFRAA